MRAMLAAMENGLQVLVPFDKREGMSLQQAAELAGKSESTIRTWCNVHGIGRRVGGGVWIVSRVALAMHLDGDRKALAAYHNGDRSGDLVGKYFCRCGLSILLVKPSVLQSPQFQQSPQSLQA